MEAIPGDNNDMEKIKTPEAYFSVINLVRRISVEKENGSIEEFTIAIRGRDTDDGRARYQAIGGGAQLAEGVAEKMKEEFGESIRFREGDDGKDSGDVRFYMKMPEETQSNPESSEEENQNAKEQEKKFVDNVMNRFSKLDANLFEDSVDREIEEELTKENQILTHDEAKNIETNYVGAVSPVQWPETEITSHRISDDNEGYFRIFHLFDIKVSETIFEKIKSSDAVRLLSPEDVEIMFEASKQGKATATLSDGSVIVENIFPDFTELLQKEKDV